MIRLTAAQEQALARVIRAEALPDVVGIFEAERTRWQQQYEQLKEVLVVSGTGRDAALQVRGRLETLNDVLDMFERQKV